jgi:hypothetical protein
LSGLALRTLGIFPLGNANLNRQFALDRNSELTLKQFKRYSLSAVSARMSRCVGRFSRCRASAANTKGKMPAIRAARASLSVNRKRQNTMAAESKLDNATQKQNDEKTRCCFASLPIGLGSRPLSEWNDPKSSLKMQWRWSWTNLVILWSSDHGKPTRLKEIAPLLKAGQSRFDPKGSKSPSATNARRERSRKPT